jgi:AcrR family transcriptional regulator
MTTLESKRTAAQLEHALEKKQQSFDDLLRAGVIEISKHGIDRVTVAHITKASGCSRTTFYTYFGDIPGLCAEIWLRFGKNWLNSKSNVSGKPETVRDFQTELETALMDIFAAAHRIPEIREVVLPDTSAWWGEQITGPETNALSSVWVLGSRLGAEFSAPVTPEIKAVQGLFGMFAAMPALPIDELFIGKLSSAYNPSGLTLEEVDTDDVESQLMTSAIAVIAASGVAAASVSRVARKTRVSTGSVYPRFKNIGAIVDSAFDWSIRQIVENNTSQLSDAVPAGDLYGEIAVGGLSPKRDIWRNFRIEMHLEARVNPAVAQRMAPGLQETNETLAKTIPAFAVPQELGLVIAHLMQALAIGFSLLHNVDIPVATLDHRQMTNFILKSLPQLA